MNSATTTLFCSALQATGPARCGQEAVVLFHHGADKLPRCAKCLAVALAAHRVARIQLLVPLGEIPEALREKAKQRTLMEEETYARSQQTPQ